MAARANARPAALLPIWNDRLAAREDLQRCRHRLGKLLLRRGLHYAGRNWSRAHRAWIDGLAWAQPAERVVVDDYLLAIDHLGRRCESAAQQCRHLRLIDAHHWSGGHGLK